jgi:hypothetical protein
VHRKPSRTCERPRYPARREFRVRERTHLARPRVRGAGGGAGMGVELAWNPGDWVNERREGAGQDLASIARASQREDGGGGWGVGRVGDELNCGVSSGVSSRLQACTHPGPEIQ